MLKSKYLRKCMLLVLIFLGITIININKSIVYVPNDKEMLDYQFNILTVSTVFAGFSFTALGMLLGFSSEKFVERLKNTSYMHDNTTKLISSIIYFCSSMIVSIIYVLGIDSFIVGLIGKIPKITNEMANQFLLITCVGFLIAGFIQFMIELKEFSKLLSFIYEIKKIDEAEKKHFSEALEKAKALARNKADTEEENN